MLAFMAQLFYISIYTLFFYKSLFLSDSTLKCILSTGTKLFIKSNLFGSLSNYANQ